jgi:hypothetical protein
MAGGFWRGVKRFVLWNYDRATWQYDVMVGLILAFVFLTPREWFHDQPRIPKASQIAMLPGAHGTNVFWIDSELLAGVPDSERDGRATQMLRVQTGTKSLEVTRLEPIRDSEEEIKGFLAFTKP